jgi:hypothetical protein
MSFFSDLFTRKITFIEWMGRDLTYPDLLHVFGAIRVMPDEGDSFDIYRHSVIDLNTYAVTNGLQQRGTDFSIKSEFVKRCIAQMSAQMNRKLKVLPEEAAKPVYQVHTETQIEEDSDDDSDDDTDDDFEDDTDETDDVAAASTQIFNYGNEPAAEEEEDRLEDHCEIPVVDRDINESDTGEAKKLPKRGLIFTKNKLGDKERFLLCLRKSGRDLAQHQMSGMEDYFRFVFDLKQTNRILGTYRKENLFGAGGMAFYVLDANTGELLHNDFIK